MNFIVFIIKLLLLRNVETCCDKISKRRYLSLKILWNVRVKNAGNSLFFTLKKFFSILVGSVSDSNFFRNEKSIRKKIIKLFLNVNDFARTSWKLGMSKFSDFAFQPSLRAEIFFVVDFRRFIEALQVYEHPSCHFEFFF